MSLKANKFKVLPPGLEPGAPHTGLLRQAWLGEAPERTTVPEPGRSSPSKGSTAAQG